MDKSSSSRLFMSSSNRPYELTWALAVDVTDADAVHAAAERTERELGTVNLLVMAGRDGAREGKGNRFPSLRDASAAMPMQ